MSVKKGTKRPPGWINPAKGRPNPRAGRPLEVRFWSKVVKEPGGCWTWTGALRHGHGTIHVGGNNKRVDYTHRIVYRLLDREIPAGMEVDHVCRNRACCNPDHLRFVTKGQNCIENNLNPFATNARKTHCKNGHLLAGDNVVWHRRPKDYGPVRCCIVCRPYQANSMYRIPPPSEDSPR
jgi:hypothetical protein